MRIFAKGIVKHEFSGKSRKENFMRFLLPCWQDMFSLAIYPYHLLAYAGWLRYRFLEKTP
jgi:hypothetical protein